jgi:CxxC motif-containing protein
MKKRLICIECPNGCEIEAEIIDNRVISVTGNKCERGETYSKQELENPLRTLASTVLAKGLSVKLIPVRTSGPIPKNRLFEAIEVIKTIRITQPVQANEVIQANFLSLPVDLIATRRVV